LTDRYWPLAAFANRLKGGQCYWYKAIQETLGQTMVTISGQTMDLYAQDNLLKICVKKSASSA
jgi:hypothetical protein